MKKTMIVMGSLALSLVACVKQDQAASVDAPIAVVPMPATTEPAPAPDAPRDVTDRFPAGPGVTIVADQLQALVRDRRVTDRTVPYDQRVAIAQQALGVSGEPYADTQLQGVVFRGVSGRATASPFGCTELILSRRGAGWTIRPADHRHCGLPYAVDPLRTFNGLGPKRSAFRLEEVRAEAERLADPEAHVRAKLGAPDLGELLHSGESRWSGFGARTKDAPISCRQLRVEGAAVHIADVPLASCGLAWPMPGMTFEAGPTEPPIDRDAKLAECAQRCSSKEICMIDQRVPGMAILRVEADGARARYIDGRSAKVEVVASCVAIPPACSSTVTATCLFPAPTAGAPPSPPTGPCAHGIRTLASAPADHILCQSRAGMVPPPPPPPAPNIGPTKPKPGNIDVQQLF